jgi:hypothetical protein
VAGLEAALVDEVLKLERPVRYTGPGLNGEQILYLRPTYYEWLRILELARKAKEAA